MGTNLPTERETFAEVGFRLGKFSTYYIMVVFEILLLLLQFFLHLILACVYVTFCIVSFKFSPAECSYRFRSSREKVYTHIWRL